MFCPFFTSVFDIFALFCGYRDLSHIFHDANLFHEDTNYGVKHYEFCLMNLFVKQYSCLNDNIENIFLSFEHNGLHW